MNIFILSLDPREAAINQCDQHVVKMTLESAQQLCSAFQSGDAPYKRTHWNHPCSVWTRQSYANFDWHIAHALELAGEYTRRYGKTHKSYEVIQWCQRNKTILNLPQIGLTPFALAMPAQYRGACPVESYREFYIGEKRFARWRHTRKPPAWWTSQSASPATVMGACAGEVARNKPLTRL